MNKSKWGLAPIISNVLHVIFFTILLRLSLLICSEKVSKCTCLYANILAINQGALVSVKLQWF